MQGRTVINSSPDCQRVALLNYYKTALNQDEGQPIKHPIRDSALFGKFDWNINAAHKLNASYNFDRSRNENQTFDVPTYGNSANAIEGDPAHIQAYNVNLFSTLTPKVLNEGHFGYSRDSRPRTAVKSNVPPDTAMGFATTFRFGNPFFISPRIDELFWRTQLRDNLSIVSGKHTWKFGGEWIHSLNDQIFRGFFEGRYIFDSVEGFLRYASPAAAGGFGPNAAGCSNGSYVTLPATCPVGSTYTGGPLLFYLQDGTPTGLVNIPPGKSTITNQDYALFAQDRWQVLPNLTLNYGLRWEAQIFPDPVVAPSKTAYGSLVSNPLFPSDGTLHNQKAMFQPRVGFSWDVANNQKSVLRASWGIYNARQNMLTQVGSITTNGVQQYGVFKSTGLNEFLLSTFGIPPQAPTYPGTVPPPPFTGIPEFTGVRVFSRKYANPRIYTTDVAYEQEVARDWSVYADFNWSKGVHLTNFLDVNGNGYFADNGTKVLPNTFGPQLGFVFDAASRAKSLYRGLTVGMRKRFSQHYQLEWNYIVSEDLDNDSNERDPFTDRRLDPFNPARDYSFSDRDERHKFNLFGYAELPAGFILDTRLQAHTPQPITPDGCAAIPTCKRNSLWKNNEFISFDWRAMRPFKFGDRYQLVPVFEMFNTFNNANNVNPLISPGLFNFDGFLRQGVGDPRQVQLAVKFTF